MLDRAAPGAEPISAHDAAALFAPLFRGARHALLAVSGGADSTALLVAFAAWPDAPKLSVATVDHGLRPEGAAEAAQVATLSARFGLPHATLAVTLSGETRIEASARNARYAALVDHAHAIGADALATAHTLDDQAETVLMRLAAGSGPAGLSAMRAESMRNDIRHLRPFLKTPKARLVATLRARGIGWSEDAMNADRRFVRARLRGARDVLADEGLTPERLARLASRIARAEMAIKTAVETATRERVRTADSSGFVIAPHAGLPDEILLRLLGRAVRATGGGELRLERLERLLGRIADEPAGASTLAGARIVWRSDAIMVSPAPPRRHGAAAFAAL